MFIDKNNLNDYSDEDIYAFLVPRLDKIYEKYNYVIKSESELHKVVLKEIEQSKHLYTGDNNFLDYVVGRLSLKLDRYIAIKLDDSKAALNIINRFISRTVKKEINYKNAFESFKLLNHFCEKYNYYLDPDQLENLFKENLYFYEITALIVDKNIKNIKNSSFFENHDNVALCSAINTYCMLNNIEITEPDVELNENLLKTDELYLYRKEISRYKLLSPEEERAFAIRIKEGDLDAKEEFINRNLRLVMKVALKYLNRGLPLADLIQEGNIGLIAAVDRYDFTKGFRFSTYGIHWIRRAILSATRNKGREIKIPYGKFDKIGKYRATQTALAKKLNREPTLDEIAEELKLSYTKALELHNIQVEPISLNKNVGDEDITELGNLIPSKTDELEEVDKKDLTNKITGLFDETGLTQREKEVLIRRFGLYEEEQCTLEEIASGYKMSRERVRQIEKSAIEKLRRSKTIKNFSVYMNNSDKAEDNIDELVKDYYEDQDKKYRRIAEKKDEKIKSVYEAFNKYPKELVDKVLSELLPEEQDLIKARFGSDLENPENTRITKEQQKQYLNVLNPKIKFELKALTESRARAEKQRKIEEEEKQSKELSPFMKEYLSLIENKGKDRKKPFSKVLTIDKI